MLCDMYQQSLCDADGTRPSVTLRARLAPKPPAYGTHGHDADGTRPSVTLRARLAPKPPAYGTHDHS